MRKVNLVLIAILSGSVLLNCLLAYRLLTSSSGVPKIDEKLVATWKSKNPHGLRLILLDDGTFAVTNYGAPYGPMGHWEMANGRLRVSRAMDEDFQNSLFFPSTSAAVDISYTLTQNGTRLTLDQDVFGPGAKEFVKAIGEP